MESSDGGPWSLIPMLGNSPTYCATCLIGSPSMLLNGPQMYKLSRQKVRSYTREKSLAWGGGVVNAPGNPLH